MKLINKKFSLTFSFLFFVEVISFYSFLFKDFSKISFVILLVLLFFVACNNLQNALLVAVSELIVGSKGYLFFVDIFNFTLSIRIAIWLVVMLVFVAKFSKFLYKNYYKEKLKLIKDIKKILKETFLKYYLILFVFIFFSLMVATLKGNNFSNIFFDFNGWMFFSYVFPLYFAFYKKDYDKNLIKNFFLASFSWVIFKTFFLLFLFSHEIHSLMPSIYSWVRETGVGEITKMKYGFYRIFFQSHIYFTILIFYLLADYVYSFLVKNNKKSILHFLFISSVLAVNILSLSRSNWVGIVIGLIFIISYILYKRNFIIFLKSIFYFSLMLLISVMMIGLLISFPYPKSNSKFNPSFFVERASTISGEAGVSSRWSLLPPLVNEIKSNFFLGAGFGKTVTYTSSDPRVLQNNPEGVYETFSFEWGWFDILLKFGIFGFLFFCFFIIRLGQKIFVSNNFLKNRNETFYFSLLTGLLVLSVINFFSPYLNHPLGIGYLLFISIIYEG